MHGSSYSLQELELGCTSPSYGGKDEMDGVRHQYIYGGKDESKRKEKHILVS